MKPSPITLPARDAYPLTGVLYRSSQNPQRVVVINNATGVSQHFYRHFAAALAAAGFTALTYDYRGIGDSKPTSLRGFAAAVRDWALLDMAGVLDWVRETLHPERIFFVGHSLGGQVAGLLEDASPIDGMVTQSAQSGYWRLQGGEQKLVVLLHVHLTLPLLARLFGYLPWSRFGGSQDLPKAAALEWARWCRHPRYLLGDPTLPLDRYARFSAPVLAYSFADDKWGTPRAVDAMMRAYPNLERRHVEHAELGLKAIGHFGYFRPTATLLWNETIRWLDTL